MSAEKKAGQTGLPDAVYDIREPRFWERGSLDSEFGRVFDICHQCRRCFDLCPSFDVMFKTIDSAGEDASVLTSRDNKQILDLCYQCKLCYNHCPYTPPHQWALDFPRLMLRAKAVEVQERGRVTLQDKALGKTDAIGKAGSRFSPLSNISNRNPLNSSRTQSARISSRNVLQMV